jgi:hypothetical protein
VVGDVEERGDRGEADELRLVHLDAILRRLGPDRLPDAPERGDPEVKKVHGHLGSLELVDEEAVGQDPRQAAAGLADPAGDPLGQLDIGRVEVDVVGDEERPRPDRDRAGRGMHLRRSDVRFAAALRDLDLQPLVLAAPDIGQLDPIGAASSLGIEVDREVEALGDPARKRPSQLDRLVHRRVAEGDEGNDVDRPDPGMLTRVLVHVDLADRARDQAFQRLGDGAGRPSKREHRAIVARIARPIEEMNAIDRADRRRQPIDDVETATLGYVRNRFDETIGQAGGQLGHQSISCHALTGRTCPARRTLALTNAC